MTPIRPKQVKHITRLIVSKPSLNELRDMLKMIQIDRAYTQRAIELKERRK